jgi:hypothetical protein
MRQNIEVNRRRIKDFGSKYKKKITNKEKSSRAVDKSIGYDTIQRSKRGDRSCD